MSGDGQGGRGAKSAEERVVELEMKLMHFERTQEALDQALLDHESRITHLERMLEKVVERVRGLGERAEGDGRAVGDGNV